MLLLFCFSLLALFERCYFLPIVYIIVIPAKINSTTIVTTSATSVIPDCFCLIFFFHCFYFLHFLLVFPILTILYINFKGICYSRITYLYISLSMCAIKCQYISNKTHHFRFCATCDVSFLYLFLYPSNASKSLFPQMYLKLYHVNLIFLQYGG